MKNQGTNLSHVIGFLASFFVLSQDVFPQVRIHEKVTIDPKAIHSPQTTESGDIMFVVKFTFSGTISSGPSFPHFMRLTNCVADKSLDPIPASISIPARSGTNKANIRWNTPTGGTWHYTFEIDGAVIQEDSRVVTNCGCTVNLLPEIFLNSGMKFTLPSSVTHGDSVPITMTNKPFTACSKTVWHPLMKTTISITEGQEFGSFYDEFGTRMGASVTGNQFELARIKYKADGDQPENGTARLKLEASSQGVTIGDSEIEIKGTAPLIDSLRTSAGKLKFPEGTTISLQGYFHDPDNDEQIAQWSTIESPDGNLMSTLPVSNPTSPVNQMFVLENEGFYRFRFEVTDVLGHQSSRILIVEAVGVDHFRLVLEKDSLEYKEQMSVTVIAEDKYNEEFPLNATKKILFSSDVAPLVRFLSPSGDTAHDYGDARTANIKLIADGLLPKKGPIDVRAIARLSENTDKSGSKDFVVDGGCLVFTTTPGTVATGETSQLTFRYSGKSDLVDYQSQQLFNVSLRGDSTSGTLLSSTGEQGTRLTAIPQPITYIAPSDIEGDSLEIFLEASPTYAPAPSVTISNVLASANGQFDASASTQDFCAFGKVVVEKKEFNILLGETKYYYTVLDGDNLTIKEATTPERPADAVSSDVWLEAANRPVYRIQGSKLGVYWEKDKIQPNGEALLSGMIRLVGRYNDGQDHQVGLEAEYEGKHAFATISIMRPKKLGNEHSKIIDVLGNADVNLDSRIIEFSGKHGIPPQIIKAQIEQESSFSPAYRWEPFIDAVYINQQGAVYVDEKFRYKIISETEFGDPTIPSNHVNVQPTNYPREFTTIWQRFFSRSRTLNSQASMNEYPIFDSSGKLKWYRAPARDYLAIFGLTYTAAVFAFEANPAQVATDAANDWLQNEYRGGVMNEIAQTRTAASYGLLQMTYLSATGERDYPIDFVGGSNGNLPENLNDMEVNFSYAISFLEQKINDELSARGLSQDKSNQWPVGFEKILICALNRYNGMKDFRETWHYGFDVMSKSAKYEPKDKESF